MISILDRPAQYKRFAGAVPMTRDVIYSVSARAMTYHDVYGLKTQPRRIASVLHYASLQTAAKAPRATPPEALDTTGCATRLQPNAVGDCQAKSRIAKPAALLGAVTSTFARL